MRDTEREGEHSRDTGRGRSRLPAGSPTWDSIPGLQDHALGGKMVLTAGPPGLHPKPVFSAFIQCFSLTYNGWADRSKSEFSKRCFHIALRIFYFSMAL